jgi:hypothetical protein
VKEVKMNSNSKFEKLSEDFSNKTIPENINPKVENMVLEALQYRNFDSALAKRDFKIEKWSSKVSLLCYYHFDAGTGDYSRLKMNYSIEELQVLFDELFDYYAFQFLENIVNSQFKQKNRRNKTNTFKTVIPTDCRTSK